MTKDTIQLIIVKDDNLLREWEISSDSTLGPYTVINVVASLTPNQIIQKALGLPLQKSKRVRRKRKPFELIGKKYTLVTSYHMTCPSLQKGLQLEVPIGEQGIVNDTVFLLIKEEQAIYDRPEDSPNHNVMFCLLAVRDVPHFNKLVQTHIDKFADLKLDEEMFFLDLDIEEGTKSFLAVLLYTDEDAELAKYVRLNFASLDKMSSLDCNVFVIEQPPQMTMADIIKYWKGLLAFETYVLWSSVGWTRTKPYDKSVTYDLARQLGIFPHQLPCIAFFDEITDDKKVIIPIQGEPATFFRELFGLLQEIHTVSPQERGNRQSSLRKMQLVEIKERIINLGKRVASDGDITTYNFNGHTIFINQPTGFIQLSNFQNIHDSSSEISSKGEIQK